VSSSIAFLEYMAHRRDPCVPVCVPLEFGSRGVLDHPLAGLAVKVGLRDAALHPRGHARRAARLVGRGVGRRHRRRRLWCRSSGRSGRAGSGWERGHSQVASLSTLRDVSVKANSPRRSEPNSAVQRKAKRSMRADRQLELALYINLQTLRDLSFPYRRPPRCTEGF
jgi:hypothetical protein